MIDVLISICLVGLLFFVPFYLLLFFFFFFFFFLLPFFSHVSMNLWVLDAFLGVSYGYTPSANFCLLPPPKVIRLANVCA